MGDGGKKKRKRSSSRVDPATLRARMLERLGTASSTSAWARSSNPVKARIAALEAAWREGLQWIFEDMQKMFANFALVSEGIDDVDINTAAMKALLVEKGVFTEAEFQDRRRHVQEMVNRIRLQKQKELEEAQAAAESDVDEEEVARAEAAASEAGDGSTVDPELQEMRRKAKEAGEKPSAPEGAFYFGG